MRRATTTRSAERRLGVLDALRLFAAVSVLAFHYTARQSPAWGGPAPEELAGVGRWAAYGQMGVPLFFVISGFVLLMSAWGRDVRGFVASRVGRLFPAYWVAVAFSIVLVLFIWPENPAFLGHEITKGGAVLNLTMLQGAFGVPDVDGPYWTLWYEARFYLLIALFMLVGITRNRVLAFCALWPVVGAMAAGSGSSLATAFLMPDYAPFFAGGMLLYLIYRDGHDLGSWLLVGLQVAFSLQFATRFYPEVLRIDTPWAPSVAVVAVICVACFGLVALVTLTPVARHSAAWMTLAGALTYPIYLVHENLGWWVIHLVRDRVGPWGAVALATVVAFAAAFALHHLVEKPFGPRLRTATLRMLERSTEPAAATPSGIPPATAAQAPLPAVAAGPVRHARAGEADVRPVPARPSPGDLHVSARERRPYGSHHGLDAVHGLDAAHGEPVHVERRRSRHGERDTADAEPSTVVFPPAMPQPRVDRTLSGTP
jgi:peptidoglycan/LPS O-acetylase OafA/YrhL